MTLHRLEIVLIPKPPTKVDCIPFLNTEFNIFRFSLHVLGQYVLTRQLFCGLDFQPFNFHGLLMNNPFNTTHGCDSINAISYTYRNIHFLPRDCFQDFDFEPFNVEA